MKTYEAIEIEGYVMTRPEHVGWQTVGRGDYLFSELVKRYGTDAFNKPDCAPPNFEELNEKQFTSKFDYYEYPIIATTYRKLVADPDGTMWGYALQGHLYVNSLGKGHMLHFDSLRRRTRYFIFYFCDHEFKVTSHSMNFLEETCRLCHFKRTNIQD